MKNVLVLSALLALSAPLYAQPDDGRTRDLYEVITEVTDDLGVETIIDPRVRGISVYATGEDLDYDSLLGILRVHSFFALETADQILIVPEQNARAEATRVVQQDDPSISDHAIVTRVVDVPELPDTRTAEQISAQLAENPFAVSSSSAAQFVPVLRPMLRQDAQLGAIPGTNKLIIIDRYDNVRRITAIIEAIAEGLGD